MRFNPSIKIFSVVVVIVVFAFSNLSAQTENSSARRNSPFSPNPKKRIETANVVLPNNESTGIITLADKASENAAPQNENPEIIQDQNLNNRSIANKTLEVVKRAAKANTSPVDQYKVGIGDILFIALQNAPAKETNYFTILQDGTIDYPLAGELVSVVGLTTEQIENLLEEKIKLYENPQITVKIREYNSHSYMVIGLVEKSGERFLQREAVPLFVVRAEAAVQSKADRAIIKRKNAETETLDLKDEKSGETLIFSGDIVEFSSNDLNDDSAKTPQYYYIGGEIISSGQKPFHYGLTLTQAIIASEGLKNKRIKKAIIRRKNESGMLVSLEADLKAIKEGKAIDPALQSGDTVEIGN